jgi:hypothetical protein
MKSLYSKFVSALILIKAWGKRAPGGMKLSGAASQGLGRVFRVHDLTESLPLMPAKMI